MQENKVVPVGYRFKKSLLERIEKFREKKSEQLGLKLTKNEAVEILLNEGLLLNNL